MSALVEFSTVSGGLLSLEGTLEMEDFQGDASLFALDASGRRYSARIEEMPDLGGAGRARAFRWFLEVPLLSVEFRVSFDSGNDRPLFLNAGRFSRLRFVPGSYLYEGGVLLETPEPGAIRASAATVQAVLDCESTYQGVLRRQGVSAPWVFALRDEEVKRRLGLQVRGGAQPVRMLLCDRPERGGDNAEALFRFLHAEAEGAFDAAFAVSSRNEDYSRLERFGRVIPFGSDEHLRAHLSSDIVASSHAAQSIVNPFGRFEAAFADLARARFVFLQHGVTKDDVSKWLARNKTNISLFVTASERERDSIVSNPAYGFRPEQVVATGFPRHDFLGNRGRAHGKRVLMIAPTWRADLCLPALPRSRRHFPNPCFSHSSYFRFWNAMITDERIRDFASERGWKVRFVLHPAFAQEAKKFSTSFAEIVSAADYLSEILDASVFVTDYSSLAFDAALAGLPVVYAQEDRQRFYEGHGFMAPGYFSYDRDGLGPVCTSYEATIGCILRYMDHPVREDLYSQRAESFFVWPDASTGGFARCRAVTQAMRSLVS